MHILQRNKRSVFPKKQPVLPDSCGFFTRYSIVNMYTLNIFIYITQSVTCYTLLFCSFFLYGLDICP